MTTGGTARLLCCAKLPGEVGIFHPQFDQGRYRRYLEAISRRLRELSTGFGFLDSFVLAEDRLNRRVEVFARPPKTAHIDSVDPRPDKAIEEIRILSRVP